MNLNPYLKHISTTYTILTLNGLKIKIKSIKPPEEYKRKKSKL
jgi:hypothetical protein